MPTCACRSEKTTSSSRAPRGCRENRSRSRLLPGLRGAHSKSAVPADPVAQDTAVAEAAVSTAVHRTSFVSELEPDGWQERPLGRQATWTQYRDHAADLCGL